MSYDAKVLEVMIASPSDVVREREVVRAVISEWNDIHARSRALVLLPVGWDTHSAPDLSGRPQQIINERILDHADIVVGIFWTKIGSFTGVAASGSVEEIQRHHNAKKPVMLYFSDMPVVPGSYDTAQFSQLTEFKDWARTQGLVSSFSDPESFRRDFAKHLQITLRDNPYVIRQSPTSPDEVPMIQVAPTLAGMAPSQLSHEAIELLRFAGASHGNNVIFVTRTIGGASISAGDQEIEASSNREIAKWEAGAQQLYRLGLTRDVSGKQEIFELNDRGFQAADTLAKGR